MAHIDTLDAESLANQAFYQAEEDQDSPPSPDDLQALLELLDDEERRADLLKILYAVEGKPEGVLPAQVQMWEGGSFVGVKRLRAKLDQKGGGPRSAITVFSKASRRRLQEFIAKLRKDDLPAWFLTLTYPDRFPQDPKVWKRHLLAFNMRLLRKYPDAADLWRLEIIDRKSGENKGEAAPHIHMLVWNVPRIKKCPNWRWVKRRGDWVKKSCGKCLKCKRNQKIRDWISQAWYEVVKSGDPKHLAAGTTTYAINNQRHLNQYVSKVQGRVDETMIGEMSKVRQTLLQGVGRWWGAWAGLDRRRLPWAGRLIPWTDDQGRKRMKWVPTSVRLVDIEAVQMIRLLRRLGSRWAWAQVKNLQDPILKRRAKRKGKAEDDWIRVKRKVSSRAYKSLSVFMDADWLIDSLVKLTIVPPPWQAGELRSSIFAM